MKVKQNEILALGPSRRLDQSIRLPRQEVPELSPERPDDAAVDERQLLKTLLDNVPSKIYFKDRQSRLIRFSRSKALTTFDSARRMHRASHPDEEPANWPAHLADIESFSQWLVGKTDFDTFPESHARVAYENEQEIMRTGEAMIGYLEEREIADGQSVCWLSSKMPWRDSDGRIIGTFGSSLDITPLKHAEKSLSRERLLLRTLIDHLPDAIFAKDTAGRKTVANPADLKNLGCRSEAEAIGKTDFDHFPPEVADKFWADDRKVLQGEPVINREEYFFDKQGQKHWLLTTKLPRRDTDGTIIGLVGIGRDITEMKLAQEALRESTAQLERSNRELQDFAYVASHDLQEPLRKIVVFGDRLREKSGPALDDEALDSLERMQKAARRMQTLINDLLAFSRVTTRAHPFAPVDLAKVAREVVDDLEARIAQAGGRVELGDLPVVDAEPLQMRQLLQNLIGNALKFHCPDRPPVVKVAANKLSDFPPESLPGGRAAEFCQLTVSDNGIGFDEKYLDRIFNVFQRLHARNEYEGTGMGLAIARKIVLHHRGTITAKSAPGQGATFIVTLPVNHPKTLASGSP